MSQLSKLAAGSDKTKLDPKLLMKVKVSGNFEVWE